MSIIIRLQNLPWSANALDIRQYFTGLQIPEGGVHIVGGELGDAFIAFSTDEDARQAFLRNDGKIKSVQIKLMLSSRTEMQRVIEQARTQSMAAFMLPANTPVSAPLPAAVPAAIPQVIPPVIPSVVPAVVPAVPETKRDSKERESDSSKKKDRKRSRSRSKSRERDRRDRSRDRKDRRHRDRSRSRSRDRRDRRRRDRSRSRNRSRDRESRRKDRARTPKREERDDSRKPVPEVWANRATPNQSTLNIIPPAMGPNSGAGILGAFPGMLDRTKRNMADNRSVNMPAQQGLNGFSGNNQIRNQPFPMENQQRQRESWPPANVVPTSSVPLAVAAEQRRKMLENLRRSTDGFQAGPQTNQAVHSPRDNIRGSRDDFQRDINSRESRERPVESRKENGGRRSRFDDDGSTPQNSCISMEPFYGSYGDLRRFFNGLSINYRGIKVINDEKGHKTGICYVQFRDSNFKGEALNMNGHKLNNMPVKIQHINDKIFEEAIDRYNPRMDGDKDAEDPQFRSRNITKYFNKSPTSAEMDIKDFISLKVEDLPTFVKEQDILHIFSPHPLISLHLNFKPKGGSVAYVKFSSKEVAKLAAAETSHHVIGGKPVTVKPCSDEEFDKVNKEQNVALEDSKPKDIGTDCLSISKLPAKTTDRDISDFFSDIGVLPTKIHLMSNNLGFTGQAYCEFETKEEATKAIAKDNTVLGSSTILVFPISRTEMEQILGNTLPHPGIPTTLPLAPGTPLPPIKSVADQQSVKPEPVADVSEVTRSEPFTRSEVAPEIQDKPIPVERTPDAPVKRLETSRSNDIPVPDVPKNPPLQVATHPGIPSRPALIRSPDDFDDISREDFENPEGPDDEGSLRGPETREKLNFVAPRDGPEGFPGSRGHPRHFNGPSRPSMDQRDNMMGPRGSGSRGSRFGSRGGSRFSDFDDSPRFNSRISDGPGSRFNKPRYNPNIDEGSLDDLPGCTVYMDNVPYKAGTNEILDFFEGFNCTNNVSRRYNPNNTPSAEAKVTFYTPEDAYRAVRELHGAKIWSRTIYLRQA